MQNYFPKQFLCTCDRQQNVPSLMTTVFTDIAARTVSLASHIFLTPGPCCMQPAIRTCENGCVTFAPMVRNSTKKKSLRRRRKREGSGEEQRALNVRRDKRVDFGIVTYLLTTTHRHTSRLLTGYPETVSAVLPSLLLQTPKPSRGRQRALSGEWKVPITQPSACGHAHKRSHVPLSADAISKTRNERSL